MVCDKHKLNPVKGYSPCVGCEIEYLNDKIKTLEVKIEWFRETVDSKNIYINQLEKEIEELKGEIKTEGVATTEYNLSLLTTNEPLVKKMLYKVTLKPVIQY